MIKKLILPLLFMFVYVQADVICKNKESGLIGVTDVEMSNKTARLVFEKEGIQSQTAIALENSGCFNVLDWQRLKESIQRNKIEWSDIKSSQQQREKLKEAISVDYFLVVSISSFSDDTEYSNDSFSKSKKQVVKIKVDLMIKNALSNRVIKSVSSEAQSSKKLTQNLGFGASGNPIGELPNKAFMMALNKNIEKLSKTSLPKMKNKQVKNKNQNNKDPFSLLAKKSNKNYCDGKWIESNGISGIEKGIYIAKKRAIMDAYKNAVSKGAGVHIEEFTEAKMSENLSNVYSVISKKVKGFISYYDVINEGQRDKNTYQISIKACIIDKEVDDFNFENGLKLFVEMLGKPKVLVVFGQERYSEDKLVEKTIKKNNTIEKYISKKDEMQIRSIEINIAKQLKSYGYEVITSDDMANRGIVNEEKILKARKGIGGSAIEFARDSGADIVISGNIVYALSRSEISDVDGKLVTASINAKAIMPGSGKVLGFYSEQGQSFSLINDQMSAKEEVINQASKSIVQKIIWDVPKYLLDEEREIELVLNNISYKDVRKVKKILKTQKEILGIKTAGKWKNRKIYLIVQTSYFGVVADDILDILENNTYNFDVDETTDFYIQLTIK